MKLLKKTLAVAMSLSLCVAMVAPAFAATFSDLNAAISDDYDSKNIIGAELGNGVYGYDAQTDENGDTSYGIRAWDDEDGTRNVQLNDDVTYDEDEDGSTTTIVIGHNQTVDLNMNGHDIDGGASDGPVFVILEGDPEWGKDLSPNDPLPDPSQAPGELNIINTNGTSTITGENGGIEVGAGASLSIGDGVDIDGGDGNYDVLLKYDEVNDRGATATGGNWTDADGTSYSGEVSSSNGPLSLTFIPTSQDSGDAAEDEDTMTGAEFVNYIWEHEGRPEPVGEDSAPSDQEYAAAIAWARSIGLVDDEIRLDELMTVSNVRTVLTRLAAWKGMEMPELAALTGKEEDPVRNCLDVLKEFFGED